MAQQDSNEALLVVRTPYDEELRYAKRRSDMWPKNGDDPLGQVGYWMGNPRRHAFVGRRLTDREPEPRNPLRFFALAIQLLCLMWLAVCTFVLGATIGAF